MNGFGQRLELALLEGPNTDKLCPRGFHLKYLTCCSDEEQSQKNTAKGISNMFMQTMSFVLPSTAKNLIMNLELQRNETQNS